MKTQITKENAVSILESLIRQQRLNNKLGEIMDTTANEWMVDFARITTALFNVVDDRTDETMDPYYKAFYKAVFAKSKDYDKLAEKLYTKCYNVSIKQERVKTNSPGVISLLKGQKYNIEGKFGLET